MAKISPVSIKYMIHAKFIAQGAVEKPDVIGALFGQTEGLLGNDLEMRDLQKEGKIGRIEVDLKSQNGKTIGEIEIPTALDQSETTLIAAAIETIERIGPTDSKIEVEKIEDVRGSKRDYILDRAKKLMSNFSEKSSKELSEGIKLSARTDKIQEYGYEKLPSGEIKNEEKIIVVEGRADVLNLLKNGVKNVIGMDGTKLPETIKKLSYDKEITLFIDGDRGGKLIAKNAIDNAKIKFVAIAPEGKEVEELTGKEILQTLRKKILVNEFFKNHDERKDKRKSYQKTRKEETEQVFETAEKKELNEEDKKKISEIAEKIKGTKKAAIIDRDLSIKRTSARGISSALRRNPKSIAVIVDGIATPTIIKTAERAKISVLYAKNFASTETNLELKSL